LSEEGDPMGERHDDDDPLGERLLDLDPHDPALRKRYEAGLDSHLEGHLSGSRRARYVVVGLAGLAGSLVCGSLAITEPASTPGAVRWLLALFAFFGMSWTLLAAWALARGRGDYIAQRTLAARMAFGFTLTSVIALAVVSFLSGRAAVGMPMVATGLALLILAAVLLIDARIERSESLIREQVLRVEHRLTALAEAIERLHGGRDVEG
jgi:hypothetical protein